MSTTPEENILRNEWETQFGGAECFDVHKSKVLATYSDEYRASIEEGFQPTQAHARGMSAVRAHLQSNEASIRPSVSLERFKGQAMQRFLAGGGVESEFRAQWPAIRAEHLRRQALNLSLNTDSAARKQAKKIW